MLKPINDLPPHVVGIHAYGKVTNTEYESMLLPLLTNHISIYRRINFVLVLETDIDNFSPGMWCGNVNIGLKFFFKWNKVAVVSDQKGVHGFSDLFRFFIPGKYKTFPLERLDEGLRWVSNNDNKQ